MSVFGDREKKTFQTAPERSSEFSINLSHHRLQFKPGGSTLVVSFDNAARPDNEPYEDRNSWGEAFYLREGHSVLGVIARRADWFRQVDLIRKLEELSKQGFFGAFSHVIFTGGSMGGFAAMAFAPLAPGCIVIAFSPQSTLNPKIASIDPRFPQGLRQNWNLPYSDAAKNVKAAGRAYVIYDSLLRLDRWHVERLARADHVYRLAVPGCGHGGTPVINQTRLFKEITRGMISGTMTPDRFRRLLRQRRRSLIYYLNLVDYAQTRGHPRFIPTIRKYSVPHLNEIDLETLDAGIMDAKKLVQNSHLPHTLRQKSLSRIFSAISRLRRRFLAHLH